jgi:hypothetical protein
MSEWEIAAVVDGRAAWQEVQAERFQAPSEHVRYLRRLLVRADTGLKRLAQLYPDAAMDIQRLRDDIAELPR